MKISVCCYNPTHPPWLEELIICKIIKSSTVFRCKDEHSCSLVVLFFFFFLILGTCPNALPEFSFSFYCFCLLFVFPLLHFLPLFLHLLFSLLMLWLLVFPLFFIINFHLHCAVFSKFVILHILYLWNIIELLVPLCVFLC